jgi:hypothetical protein
MCLFLLGETTLSLEESLSAPTMPAIAVLSGIHTDSLRLSSVSATNGATADRPLRGASGMVGMGAHSIGSKMPGPPTKEAGSRQPFSSLGGIRSAKRSFLGAWPLDCA